MSKSESLLRRPEVEARTGLSRSALFALVKERKFPAPIPLKGRSRAWVESEVSAWIAARIESARGKAK